MTERRMEPTVQPQDTLATLCTTNSDQESAFTFGNQREVLRITGDRRVIVSGDIYEAAQAFWDVVRGLASDGYTLEKGPTQE